MTRRDMAAILRVCAQGWQARGDVIEARRLRAKAREIEWRDGWRAPQSYKTEKETS